TGAVRTLDEDGRLDPHVPEHAAGVARVRADGVAGRVRRDELVDGDHGSATRVGRAGGDDGVGAWPAQHLVEPVDGDVEGGGGGVPAAGGGVGELILPGTVVDRGAGQPALGQEVPP